MSRDKDAKFAKTYLGLPQCKRIEPAACKEIREVRGRGTPPTTKLSRQPRPDRIRQNGHQAQPADTSQP